MVKLILNPDSDPQQFSSHGDVVCIGNAAGGNADLVLHGDTVQDIHVKIIRENGRYLIVNASNDPFAELNGQPFGKKALAQGDLIRIDNQTMRFETEEHAAEHATEDKGQERPEEVRQSNVGDNELVAADIDALMHEVEQLDMVPMLHTQEAATPSECLPKQHKGNTENKAASPDAFCAHIDLGDSPPPPISPKHVALATKPPNRAPEEEGAAEEPASGEENQNNYLTLAKRWKLLVGGVIICVALCAGLFGMLYLQENDRNSQEEKKIAAGVADIAMALTYAQLNHIVPNKQNWADPEFIRSNLTSVLSPNIHTQAQIDNQGQFFRYPYILRVYTAPNLSRFLIIAQPAPNVLQWLVNKKTIVLDSISMEVRKIADLKNLNRLLATPSPLEGLNGDEISRTVGAGSLMSLSSLSGKLNHWGFAPPKALGLIRPGAENYIYNGPRYYPLGESLLKKAMLISQDPGASADVSMLQEELEEISKFPDLVLYTSQGLQAAVLAQKAISIFASNYKFLIGYVNFNSKGYVTNSRLLMNNEGGDVALRDPLTHSFSEGASGDNIGLQSSSPENSDNMDDFEGLYPLPAVDVHHPLYLQLNSIASARSRALKGIRDEVITLLQKQEREMQPDFEDRIQKLLTAYLEEDASQKKKMVHELSQLYQEYSETPLEEFMKFVEATSLTSFVREALKTKQSLSEAPLAEKQSFDIMLTGIRKADSLSELDNLVVEASLNLNLERLPDPSVLIAYQEKVHNAVLDKVAALLLAPQSPMLAQPLQDMDRVTLIRILKTAWVTDQGELDYFVNEFDHLRQLSH